MKPLSRSFAQAGNLDVAHLQGEQLCSSLRHQMFQLLQGQCWHVLPHSVHAFRVYGVRIGQNGKHTVGEDMGLEA